MSDDILNQAARVAGEHWHATEDDEDAEIERRIKARIDEMFAACADNPNLLLLARLRKFLVEKFCGCWLNASIFVYDIYQSYNILTGEGREETATRLYLVTCLRHHTEDDRLQVVNIIARQVGPNFQLLKPREIGV